MLILCSKFNSNENSISGHLYVNSIYCLLKASMEQREIIGFRADRQQFFF